MKHDVETVQKLLEQVIWPLDRYWIWTRKEFISLIVAVRTLVAVLFSRIKHTVIWPCADWCSESVILLVHGVLQCSQ